MTSINEDLEYAAIVTALTLYVDEIHASKNVATKSQPSSIYSPWAFKGFVMRQIPVKR